MNITPWLSSRAVASDPSDPSGNTFCYFCESGTGDGLRWGIFYRSVDGGKTWHRGDYGKFPSYNAASSVVVHPYNRGEVYLSFPTNDDQVSPHALYRSRNEADRNLTLSLTAARLGTVSAPSLPAPMAGCVPGRAVLFMVTFPKGVARLGASVVLSVGGTAQTGAFSTGLKITSL